MKVAATDLAVEKTPVAFDMDLVNAKLDEIQQLQLEEDELDWDKPEDKARSREIWDEIDLRNEALGEIVAALKNSDVIKTLEILTEKGVSPVPALDYWLSSWC